MSIQSKPFNHNDLLYWEKQVNNPAPILLEYESVSNIIKELVNKDKVNERCKEPDNMNKYGLGFLTVTDASTESIETLREYLDIIGYKITERAADVAFIYGRKSITAFDIRQAVKMIEGGK